MEFTFESMLIEWRGPAPFVFAPIPEDDSAAIKELARRASYGWGCIPVTASIGATEFTTSIMPKDGVFLLPVKQLVQNSQKISVGDQVVATIWINMGER